MDVQQIVNSVTERVQQAANVRAVFGDPIESNGVTLIPVACVRLAGGGGGGTGNDETAGDGQKGRGMGMGARVMASPVGYIEVRDGQARMVDIVDKNKLLLGGLIVGGLALLSGMKLLAWQRRRR